MLIGNQDPRNVKWASAQSKSGEILRVGCCERATGGIVVFWDNKVLQLVGMEVGKFSLFCRFKNCEDDFSWNFTRNYGPTLRRERDCFKGGLWAIKGL